ncbi:MAG: hypothetical protein AAGH79_09195 [Bacteroidota bacterium]
MDEAIAYFLEQGDPVLQRIIPGVDLEPHTSSGDVFQDLISCIVDQQIHYRSRKVYFKKVQRVIGQEQITPRAILAKSDADFLAQKMAARKVQTIVSAAHTWEEKDYGQLDWFSLPEEAVREQLESMQGVSRWTSDMILLYTLEHPDICPLDDFRFKKYFPVAYDLETSSDWRKDMVQITEEWAPYRSTATRYLLTWGKQLQKRP